VPDAGPYLGQTPPGTTAELFAPGVVSTGMYTRDVAMTPDGSELYFGVLLGRFATILQTRLVDGVWTEPEVAPFARDARFFHLEPAISPDGRRFFFLSTRLPAGRAPAAEEIRAWTNQAIWVMDRVGEAWSEPYNLGPPVNTDGAEFFPSVTREGTLYFTRGDDEGTESYIHRARWVDGAYLEPERLGPEVNSTTSQFNAFISPDEDYLILCTGDRDDTLGGTDYYVVFRSGEDVWSEPINLGSAVNTPGAGEYSPYVSPDGRYLFFMSTRPMPEDRIPAELSRDFLVRYRAGPESGNAGIYWISTDVIEELRPSEF
jgi:Tol biopolymer transport system component